MSSNGGEVDPHAVVRRIEAEAIARDLLARSGPYWWELLIAALSFVAFTLYLLSWPGLDQSIARVSAIFLAGVLATRTLELRQLRRRVAALVMLHEGRVRDEA